jgi:hypothetical protein
MTVPVAFTGSVAASVTYELHRIHPDLKHTAIDRASIDSYPSLYNKITDESLIVDDRLSNGDMETFSGGAFTGWTKVGSPTVTAETGIVFHGTNSAKIVAGGSLAQMYQGVTMNEAELSHVRCEAWVWSDTASESRIRIDMQTGDDGDILNSSYHPGDSVWHLLVVDGTYHTSATTARAMCEVVANQTGYFDDVRLMGDPIYRYTIPTSIINGPHYVSMQRNEMVIGGTYSKFGSGHSPISGRVLRLEGMGHLSQPSTDAGTIEIGEPYVELFIAYAARYLFRAGWMQTNATERTRDRENLIDWGQEVQRLLGTPGKTMYQMSADRPTNAWNIDRASGELVFGADRSSI